MTTKIDGTQGIEFPDSTDQATAAVLLSQFTQSLTSNGWCKLPNGLIIQWCIGTGAGAVARLWPTQFPNACLHVSGTMVRGVDAAYTWVFSILSFDAAGVTYTKQFITGTGDVGSAGEDAYIIGIGY